MEIARLRSVQRALRRSRRAITRGSSVPGLDAEQNKVVHTVLHQGTKTHATPKQKLSAVETGIVESNMRNLGGGDADSAGWRQERASIYPDPTNVKHSARRYFQETKQYDSPAKGAGELAADVQRPASQYRGRYAQVEPEARRILKQAQRPSKPSRKDRRTLRRAGVPVPTRPTTRAGKPASHKKGFKPAIAELFYDPGVSVKEGQQIGAIGGHGDHVHIAADDPRSEKRFIKIAQNMGLHVGENVFVGDTPEAGVHTSGSYHYRTMKLKNGKAISGAADVTGTPEQMLAFDEKLASKFGHNVSMGAAPSYSIGGGTSLPAGAVSSYAQAHHLSAKEAWKVAKENPQAILAQHRKLYNKIKGIMGSDVGPSAEEQASAKLKTLERRYHD